MMIGLKQNPCYAEVDAGGTTFLQTVNYEVAGVSMSAIDLLFSDL